MTRVCVVNIQVKNSHKNVCKLHKIKSFWANCMHFPRQRISQENPTFLHAFVHDVFLSTPSLTTPICLLASCNFAAE